MDHPDPKMGHIPGTLPFPGPVVDQVEEPLLLCFFLVKEPALVPGPVMDQVEENLYLFLAL
jgi:hypothetical protein